MHLATLIPAALVCIAPFATAQSRPDDLREEIRRIVREEIRAALQETHGEHAEARGGNATETRVVQVEGMPLKGRKVAMVEGGKWVEVEAGNDAKVKQLRIVDGKIEGMPVEVQVHEVRGHKLGKPVEVKQVDMFHQPLKLKAGGQQPQVLFFGPEGGKGAFTISTKAQDKAEGAIEVKVEAAEECCEAAKAAKECCEAVKECCEAMKAAGECCEAGEAAKAGEKEECAECVIEVAPQPKAKKAEKDAKKKDKKKSKKAKTLEIGDDLSVVIR